MSAPLVVITGTATDIGKTHFACALVKAWAARGLKIAGVKPIETGVPRGAPSGPDGNKLGRMSTFHVKRFHAPYMLARAVSPHLAARADSIVIDPDVVARWTATIRAEADGVVLELAGGLFTPVTDRFTNADVVKALKPDATLLVVPDRLGALHDTGAVVRAARAEGVVLTGIILTRPSAPDAATGTNAAELACLVDVPILPTLPRTSVDELARGPAEAILKTLFG
jgi:dethiobiotin synthetase